VDAIAREIARYDADDAAKVTRRIRDTAGLDASVSALIGMYEDVMDEYRCAAPADAHEEFRAAAAYLRRIPSSLGAEAGLRLHAYGFLRQLYFACERVRLLRPILPSRSSLRRLGAPLRPL
jgi:hypothetical protein